MGLGKFISSQLTGILKSKIRIDGIVDSYIEQTADQCPSKEEILKLITKRNALVQGLIPIQSTINNLDKFTSTTEDIVKALQIAFNVLKFLPAPIPPFTPATVTNVMSTVLIETDKKIDQSKSILDGANEAIDIIKLEINALSIKIQQLDTQLKHCAQENGISSNQLTNTVFGLGGNEADQNANNDPSSEQFQGFLLEVNNYPNNLTYPQHIGVAKNNQGVILLKTNPSFTSNNKTLLDELKFIIQRDNLKAF